MRAARGALAKLRAAAEQQGRPSQVYEGAAMGHPHAGPCRATGHSHTRSAHGQVRPGEATPTAFANAPGSVQHVPAVASVGAAVAALHALGQRVEARARELELGESLARELRRAMKACHVLAARGALLVGSVLALLLRVEMYARLDPANGSGHENAIRRWPFARMRPGSV